MPSSALFHRFFCESRNVFAQPHPLEIGHLEFSTWICLADTENEKFCNEVLSPFFGFVSLINSKFPLSFFMKFEQIQARISELSSFNRCSKGSAVEEGIDRIQGHNHLRKLFVGASTWYEESDKIREHP